VNATEALSRIYRHNVRLNAFLTVIAGCDERPVNGGPLSGVPISLKDLIYTRGLRTTGGSKHLANFIPKRDAEIVRRLRAAGAVILGKNTLHEWAFGVTSNNEHYGAVHNPYDTSRIPGGSSGGSAVAVAMGMGEASIGTDTGGSIRIPASLCGVVGLKPTYGAVSLDGVIPLSSTMDHVGPLARSVTMAARVFEAISGRKLKPFDQGVRGMKIGVPDVFFFEQVQADVAARVRESIAKLAVLGARIRKIKVPLAAEANAAGRTILLVEALETHRRYRNRRAEYGEAVRKLLELAESVTPGEYREAKRVRLQFTRELTRLWGKVDALITPATPATAPRIGQETIDGEDTRACLTRFARVFNMTGVPAISIPCGKDQQGLPVGLQIVAAKRAESTVLRIALALEAATPVVRP
jgi:aspartyl-tRNA(Asn)/glutamyl-tRNA(Gln) amidotransferase subunit A